MPFTEIFEGEILDIIEHILSQVFRESAGGRSAGETGERTECKRKQSHNDKYYTVSYNNAQIAACFYVVYEVCRYIRYYTFENNFKSYEDRSLYRRLFIFPYAFGEGFDH